MTEIQPLPVPAKPGNSFLIKVVVGLVVLALILGGLWWWFNRPIQPVTLTVEEKAVVEAKVEAIQEVPVIQVPGEPTYEKGSQEIILTDRELNGLLNDNTALGKSLKFELGTNVILARVETDLDADLPVVGGRRLKARARFLVSDTTGKPSFVIDDLTVWGISLPNDWMAGFKGQDLLGEILGGSDGAVAGIEEFKVEPGKLVIRLAE